MMTINDDIDDGDEVWLKILHNHGFSDNEVHEIYDIVCSSLQDIICNNTVSYALAACMYQYTWHSVEGVNGVIRSKNGSCAGTPLADITYVVAMAKVLFRFHSSLTAEQLDSSVELGGFVHNFVDVGYIDDNAKPVIAHASSIVKKVSDIARVATSTFVTFGMQLNWKPGKSEATVMFRGPHAKHARSRMAENNSSCTFGCHGKSYVFRFVSHYKHWAPTPVMEIVMLLKSRVNLLLFDPRATRLGPVSCPITASLSRNV